MPKTATSKKDQVIDAALRLLRTSGLKGASLNRALEQSGAPKGSLYHYFPGGKEQLIAAALQRFEHTHAAFLESQWFTEKSFEQRWPQLVDIFVRNMNRHDFTIGCPAAACVLGLEKADINILQIANAAFDRWIKVLASGLPDIAEKDRLAFAEFLLAALEGAFILARAKRDDGPLLRTRDFVLAAYRDIVR